MNLREAKIHFVGIGGIGMSGIAELLVNMGCQVSGSDMSINSQVERLSALGVRIAHGHSGENIPPDCNAVVFSSAVKSNNPEIKEARKRQIPIIQRAEMLSELMRLKRGIAISGTHGKTTTTSMTAAVMLAANLDPTIVIGGRLDLIKSTAALGKGDWLLAEADESDGSFLRLTPEIAVSTNVDNDHLDHYKSFDGLKRAFEDFLHKIPFYGLAVICVDDPCLATISRNFHKRKMTYGFSKSAMLRAVDLKAREGGQVFSVVFEGRTLGEVNLHVPGRHNALNSLAAIAVGLELKIKFELISKGLSEFRGVDRRLQVIGESDGITIIDDYGHHPTEVKATLNALKTAYPERRLVVAFQPHRFSRTRDCWKQFLSCFDEADLVGLLDIYPAGERPIKGINSQKLAQALGRRNKNFGYWKNLSQSLREAKLALREGDILLTLGAGDVWKLGPEFLRAIKR